ncbi:MAG TPA: oligosaccharide flippase family protein [Acidobacteriota bacterium]|nr:oligosaccharide flippase family protein [Acidobacteriota bacterium]HNT17617.1 oligosaccharide flippase family protein [Acidobacteriota bacterium]
MNNIWQRLGRGFVYSLAGHGASYAIAFFLAPVYARAMAPEEFAVVSFANSLRNILMMLMPMGVGGAVVFWLNLHLNDREKRERSLGAIAALSSIYSAAWFLIFLFFGKPLIEKGFGDIGLPFLPYGLLIGLSAFLLSFATVPTSLFIAEEKIGLNALVCTLFGLVQTLLIIYFVAWLKTGAKGQIVAMFLSGIVSIIVYGWFIFKKSPFRLDKAIFRDVSKYALPLLPHSLSMWVLNLSDRMIISYYGKSFIKDLGFYSFGYTVAMVMQGIMVAMNGIWGSVFMKEARTNENAGVVLGKAASYAILLLSGAGASIILFSPEVISLLSAGRYDESAAYVPPVVLGYFFQGLYMFPGMALFHLKKTYFFPVITGASAVTNIAINFYGIPRWGVMTAAWATAAGFFVMAALSFVLGHFRFPLRYRPAPLILSAAMMAGAFFLVGCSAAGLAWKSSMLVAGAAVGGFLWSRDMKEDERS